MSDEKKLTLSGRSPLGVSKGVETGQVRQSFSHGRSKAVVVERRRKRVLKKAGPAEAPAPETPSFQPKRKKSDAAAEGELTNRERDARAEALKDSIRKAEEERKRAEEEAKRLALEEEERRQREEEERRRAAEEAAMRAARGEEEDDAATRTAADEEARRKAEEDAKRKHEEDAKRKAAEEAKRKEEEAAKLTAAKKAADERKAAEAERAAKRPDRKAPARPGRRGEERRRSGKLTVAKALEGDDGRQRSLAAYKRAQAKLRRAAGDGPAQQKQVREVVIPEAITVQELANRMAEKAPAVMKALMKMGVMATINETLDQDTAQLVVEEFGHAVKRVSEADVEIGLVGPEDEAAELVSRGPVITVMGHVDHGKTSLLDALRKTDVVSGEAGGITQHIGAYQVTLDSGAKLTYLDTPGHEAFTQMRARGAKVTDIVVLVVAADDGIMPQTVEAINHAKAAEVPMIVAINKIDKEGANPDRVRQDLLQHEVIVEAMGGDVLDVEVSALKGTGLDKLSETIALQAEVMELKANPDRAAEGVVIEAKLDKGRGPVATVLVQRGTFKVGDIFVAGAEWGRVRALVDDHGRQIKEAGPATPVEVLGLNGTPSAGDDFAAVDNEARAREVTAYRQGQLRKQRQATGPVSLETMFSAMKEAQAQEVPVVLKADVQGSVEAITTALEKLGNEEIRARILHAAVGGITEHDVSLAQASGAMIIGFNVRANRQAREAAEHNAVGIKYYSVIYDLVDEVKAAMSGQLAPEIREITLGMADIREVFTAGKAGKAAGCLIVDGVARATAKARLLRDDVVIYEGALSSLRRFKDDVAEVKAGMECGMTFQNYIDMKPGDAVELYELEEHEREL